MKNTGVIKEGIEMANTMLSLFTPQDEWKIINILKATKREISFSEIPQIPISLGYRYEDTLQFFEEEKVIEAKYPMWFVGIIDSKLPDHYNQLATNTDDIGKIAIKKGYIKEKDQIIYRFEPKYVAHNDHDIPIVGQYAVLVNKNWLLSFLRKYNFHSILYKDFEYADTVFHILCDHKPQCSLDLSSSHVLRPIFESFYNLYLSGKNVLTDKELLQEYKRITGKFISWTEFTKKKSSFGIMLNRKPCLISRIVWEFDKKNKQYKFEILPPSNTLSDDRMKI
ncbi:MAG TPA: hypothetical protein VLG12_07110 [Candidatus Saccharimonadales bacterium]|nr:hypothetical protein [Candidatus Saccharimonadales bacterium]